ncbi:MAG: hypothetical protein CMK38_00235, partial [Porticoccaceae bacterium]|nr:hypothetical protein [Porticoccaceae bacterium]
MQALFDGKSVFTYNSEIANAYICDFHRMLAEWSRNTRLDLAVRNIIISALYSSEVRMGGSGVIAAILFCNDKVNVRSSVKNKDVRVSDIEQLINAWLPRGVANRITQETFQMGGAGCAVQLKEGEQWGSTVRCLEGLVQAGGIEPIFMKQLPSSFSYEGKALVVAVDGVVESVGQIHTILEKSASQDLIILARSFLPDVANTIAVNYQQKKTRCIPFVVGDWALNNFLEFHNLGVACVSTESGDVISNVQLGGEIVASVSHNEIIL